MPFSKAPSREHSSSFVTDNFALTAFVRRIGNKPVDTGTSKVVYCGDNARVGENGLAPSDSKCPTCVEELEP